MTITHFLLVFLGSGLGGCLRFALSFSLQNWFRGSFPVGTLVVNLLACWAAAFFVSRLPVGSGDPLLRVLLLSGFCGGFSTFSTFSLENAGLLERGLWGQALVYTILSFAGGVMVFFIYAPINPRI